MKNRTFTMSVLFFFVGIGLLVKLANSDEEQQQNNLSLKDRVRPVAAKVILREEKSESSIEETLNNLGLSLERGLSVSTK